MIVNTWHILLKQQSTNDKWIASLLCCAPKQVYDVCSTDEAIAPRVAGFMPIVVHNTTRPAVISFTHSSGTASRDTSSKGNLSVQDMLV